MTLPVVPLGELCEMDRRPSPPRTLSGCVLMSLASTRHISGQP